MIGNRIESKSRKSTNMEQKIRTFPLATPYVARHPAQQKQKPGGLVSASAEKLEKQKKTSVILFVRLKINRSRKMSNENGIAVQ